MATAKTTTLTFRIEPGLKEALRTAATHERSGVAIQEQHGLSPHENRCFLIRTTSSLPQRSPCRTWQVMCPPIPARVDGGRCCDPILGIWIEVQAPIGHRVIPKEPRRLPLAPAVRRK